MKDFFVKNKCWLMTVAMFLFGNGTGGVVTFSEFTDNVVKVVEVIKKPVEKPIADLTEVKDELESKEDFKQMNVPYSERTLTGIKPVRAK